MERIEGEKERKKERNREGNGVTARVRGRENNKKENMAIICFQSNAIESCMLQAHTLSKIYSLSLM